MYVGVTADLPRRAIEQTTPRHPRRAALIRRFHICHPEFVKFPELPCFSWMHGKLREMIRTAALLRDTRGVMICGGPWLLPAWSWEWPELEQSSLRAVLEVVGADMTGQETHLMRGHGVTGVDFADIRRCWPAMAAVADRCENIGWLLHGSARLSNSERSREA